ncbi:MAG: DnaA regulatory inactivator Hda [Acidiferrobacterales bacterium]
MTHQLLLNIRLKDGCSFDNFLAASNREPLTQLRGVLASIRAGNDPTQQICFFWGEPASGKTHLLQAACQWAKSADTVAPVYVPLGLSAQISPAILQDLGQQRLVCVDDIDRISGDCAWERALFSVCERLREKGGLLVAAGRNRPSKLGLAMPDLATRLAWGLVYKLRSLKGDEMLKAMQLRAHNRGLDIPDEVMRYVFRRYPRDARSLFNLLERIDEASLAKQRRVTIPLVRALENLGDARDQHH